MQICKCVSQAQLQSSLPGQADLTSLPMLAHSSGCSASTASASRPSCSPLASCTASLELARSCARLDSTCKRSWRARGEALSCPALSLSRRCISGSASAASKRPCRAAVSNELREIMQLRWQAQLLTSCHSAEQRARTNRRRTCAAAGCWACIRRSASMYSSRHLRSCCSALACLAAGAVGCALMALNMAAWCAGCALSAAPVQHAFSVSLYKASREA